MKCQTKLGIFVMLVVISTQIIIFFIQSDTEVSTTTESQVKQDYNILKNEADEVSSYIKIIKYCTDKKQLYTHVAAEVCSKYVRNGELTNEPKTIYR